MAALATIRVEHLTSDGKTGVLQPVSRPPIGSEHVRKSIPNRRRALPAVLFFFQAEDGIRDVLVTGVQTCALPIWACLSTMSTGRSRHSWADTSSTISTGSGGNGRFISKRKAKTAPRPKTSDSSTFATAKVRKIGRASCRERV